MKCLFRIALASIAASVFLTACGGSDGPPPSISLSTSSVDADVGGATVTVNVSNSGGGALNWSASIPSGVTWARIASGASGTDAGTIRIEVDANTGAAREFQLTVSAGGSTSQTVTISQEEAPPVIDLSVGSTDLEGDGGAVTVRVSNSGFGTMDWTASLPEDANWAYIESGESGTDAGEIVVRYGLNGGADRELDVTVTAAAASNSPQSLTLNQDWFGTVACTYPRARQEIFDLMEDVYYFNDESEQAAKYGELVLEDHGTLDSMIEELRWKPETHDRGFSYWLTKVASDMVFAGEAYVFGIRLILIVDQARNPLHMEIIDVYQGSPAGDAGFQRGDKILSLNGKPIADLSNAQINAEFGPNEDGHEVTFEIEKVTGEQSTVDVAKRLVSIPTVPEEHVEVFDTEKGKVGYLHFRTFFGDANERLLDEFAEFNDQGVRHLIVDLRYNGGGSVPIAYGLATLIGGPELFENNRQTVLAKRVHNDLLSGFGWDRDRVFRVWGIRRSRTRRQVRERIRAARPRKCGFHYQPRVSFRQRADRYRAAAVRERVTDRRTDLREAGRSVRVRLLPCGPERSRFRPGHHVARFLRHGERGRVRGLLRRAGRGMRSARRQGESVGHGGRGAYRRGLALH